MHRFFVPGTYGPGDHVDLPDDEAQHLTRVLRLRTGDRVGVFDGRGHLFAATITTASKTAARVHIDAPETAAPEPRVAVTVVHAVLKGDKMDHVVRDAVMMGATAIQPVVTARTEVTLAALERGGRQERWSRVAISSAKQCGRAVVPAVLAPLPFTVILDGLAQANPPRLALMLVEPTVDRDAGALADVTTTPPPAASLVIGPEGGWTPEEVQQGSAVCRPLRFGGRTLRADAMVIVAITSLFVRWREF